MLRTMWLTSSWMWLTPSCRWNAVPYIHRLAASMRQTVLPRYLLVGAIAVVCGANLRLGTGGGIPIAEMRRGYPFVFAEQW